MTWGRRHRAGWFVRERGRAGQPPGRHTPEYVATNGVGQVGMYPLGAAGRVPADTDLGDRGGRDRYTLDEVMSGARR